jgi:hypothetical protein
MHDIPVPDIAVVYREITAHLGAGIIQLAGSRFGMVGQERAFEVYLAAGAATLAFALSLRKHSLRPSRGQVDYAHPPDFSPRENGMVYNLFHLPPK